MKALTPKTQHSFENQSAQQRLELLSKSFDKVCFATSFGIEDQVITDMIVQLGLNIDIFTLDTGRLFEQTYKLWQQTCEKYQIAIQAVLPHSEKLRVFLEKKGPNSFYQSVEDRKQCCQIRKVDGLKNHLSDYDAWIVGLRAEQSDNRSHLGVMIEDGAFGLWKLSPLLEWDQSQLEDYVKTHQVPINPLHHQGYVSIGCEPCTRAIKEGESFRSGRWWWEQSSKECGLHADYFKKT